MKQIEQIHNVYPTSTNVSSALLAPPSKMKYFRVTLPLHCTCNNHKELHRWLVIQVERQKWILEDAYPQWRLLERCSSYVFVLATAETRDWTRDLQIFSLTLSQLSYFGNDKIVTAVEHFLLSPFERAKKEGCLFRSEWCCHTCVSSTLWNPEGELLNS